MEIIPSLWLTPVKMKVCTAFGDEKGEKHLSAEPQSEGLRNVLGSLAKMPKGALASNLTEMDLLYILEAVQKRVAQTPFRP